MNLQSLNELDFSNIGGWPPLIKGIVIFLVAIIVPIAGYFLDTEEQLVRLDRAEKREQELRLDFETKQARAANLDAYKKQLAEMRESFGAMLQQLPNKTEVAELLVDVSQAGLASGLEFELFQPTGEQPKEFYAELPIKLGVIGHYHELGNFISQLAALPRIVTIHDISIGPPSGRGRARNVIDAEKSDKRTLKMEATAKTYRYLEEESGK